MRQVVFRLEYPFWGGKVTLLSLNELREKLQTTIVLGNFANNTFRKSIEMFSVK